MGLKKTKMDIERSKGAGLRDDRLTRGAEWGRKYAVITHIRSKAKHELKTLGVVI